MTCFWLLHDLFITYHLLHITCSWISSLETCSSLAYDLWMACSWFAHYLFIFCFYLFIFCSLLVHYLFITCSSLVHDLITTCLWHNVFMICSLSYRDLSLSCSQIFMTCSQWSIKTFTSVVGSNKKYLISSVKCQKKVYVIKYWGSS